mgnify:CR=1 FL=1
MATERPYIEQRLDELEARVKELFGMIVTIADSELNNITFRQATLKRKRRAILLKLSSTRRPIRKKPKRARR